jgi:regulator of sigma E protease
MFESLYGWAGLVLGFSGLIFIHELGHFALAKWNGVRVYVFSLGMGPYLVSFTFRGTLYALSLIPIGGYVKLMGQDDLNPTEDSSPDPHDYRNKRPGQKAAILAAGAAFNIMLTLLIFTLCYWHGMEMKAPTIGKMAPDSKLGQATIKVNGEDRPANLHEGERILAVNGVAVKSYFEAMLQVSGAPKGSEIVLHLDREAPNDYVYVKVNFDKKLGATGIGMSPYYQRSKYYLGFTTRDRVAVLGFKDPNDPNAPSAARDAGVKEGDTILRINGKPVNDDEAFIVEVQGCGGNKIDLLISSDANKKSDTVEERTVSVTPRFYEKTGNWRIGLSPGLLRQVTDLDAQSQAAKAGLKKGDYIIFFQPTDEHWEGSRRVYSRGALAWKKDPFDDKDVVQHAELTNLSMEGSGFNFVQKHDDTYFYQAEGGFFDALSVAWTDTVHFGGSVFTVLRGFFTGDVGGKAISGPGGIGKAMYHVASRSSIVEFLWFLGFISLNLGMLQFLPIPLLDGWHLLMVLVEKIKGSPVAPKVLEISQVVGIVIVGSLLLFATYNDFVR